MQNQFKKSTYVIAEAGINHNGNIEIAKKMIEIASQCRANAIKFQTFTPDELFSKTINPKLYNLAKTWVLTKKDHLELQNHAKKNKIDFFSTPCGFKSAKLLKSLKVPFMKIASGEITNHDLISFIAKMRIPMLVSTGMSTISEIAVIVNLIQKHKCDFVLLHCVSSYPTLAKDSNISTIPYLQNLFHVPVGFSDHTIGITVSLAAVALGASVIEKHFTLDKNMEGPDQKLSLDPNEFSELVKQTRIIEHSIGKPRSAIIGVEQKFRDNMRKSLGAAQTIPAGSIIKRSMITSFRPGTGISPFMIDSIIGRRTNKTIKKGLLFNWHDF
jgi:sialic acid synthase SpsE